MAEQQLGPPPVPYAWLAWGSQTRREQTCDSDQDHALSDALCTAEPFLALAGEIAPNRRGRLKDFLTG